jgi:ActR/RegA family two-component response regulator
VITMTATRDDYGCPPHCLDDHHARVPAFTREPPPSWHGVRLDVVRRVDAALAENDEDLEDVARRARVGRRTLQRVLNLPRPRF